MGIWFWFVLAFIAFAFITIARKWHDHSMIFTIAIGFAINANIFNATSTPIYSGPLIFSIDSILYTGFMFCVVISAIEYGVRDAKILTSSSIAAILLSTIIEFLARVSSTGYQAQYLLSSLSFIFSALGTFAGVWLMLFIFEKLKAKNLNVYLITVICILIASIVNSSIYYVFTLLTTQSTRNLLYALLGSYIGKVFCIALCLLTFYINTHIFIPNNLKEKYCKKEIKEIEKENIEENKN